MTNPVQDFRYQGKAHKRQGGNTAADGAADGAYTGELYAFVNAGVGTDTSVVAAVAGSRIRVLSYSLSGGAAGVSTATFNSKPGGAGVAISPLNSLAANGQKAEADNNGLFQTAVGEGLSITVATTAVGVRVTYILVD